jgi:histidinol phosphatase-like enzyme
VAATSHAANAVIVAVDNGINKSIPNWVRHQPILPPHGFALVVVSNQSGVGRGTILPAEAEAVHVRLVQELAAGGVTLDAALRVGVRAPGSIATLHSIEFKLFP